jgi:hypothetical protein
MFAEHLISDRPPRRVGSAHAVEVRLNWYRSLPSACVDVSLRVDGHPAEATLCVGDWWPVTKPAELLVELSEGVHELELTMRTSVPYLPPGMTIHDRTIRTVIV